jgi:hypothetical protein
MQRTSYYATHAMLQEARPARIAGLGAQDRAGRTRSCAQAMSLSQRHEYRSIGPQTSTGKTAVPAPHSWQGCRVP